RLREARKEEEIVETPASGPKLAPISRILAEREEAKAEAEARLDLKLHQPPPPPPEGDEPTAASAGDEGDDEEGDSEPIDPKVIHLKPPVIVKDLAERLSLKSFQIIKD